MEARGAARRRWLLIAALLAAPIARAQYTLERAFPNLRFSNPVDLQDPRDGSGRLFIVEQAGVIRVFENSPSASGSTPFLDIRDRVASGGEMGLLGLAFHPGFSANGLFYLNYTADNPRRTVISRFSVDPTNPQQADRDGELILLEYNQPYANHNGGQVSFGPDGYLYIASGDGGSGGDPQNNAQNLGSLLGKILRIDVDNPSEGRNYGIPPDNPFAGNTSGYREEVYAYGLRNPWRFSFDPVTGTLWTGDVGQSAREEVNIVEKGKNYGWRIMEGSLCYSPPSNCNPDGLQPPVWEYGRSEGTSITGGFVYRGSRLPGLASAYIYGDYGSGRIWALRYDGVNPALNTQIAQLGGFRLVSFGVDSQNELFICSYDGILYRLSGPPTSVEESMVPDGIELLQNFPNPFNPSTTIRFRLELPAFVTLTIFDLLGEEIALLAVGVQPAGVHTVSWDASGLGSGVYLCRLHADGRVRVRKLMVIR